MHHRSIIVVALTVACGPADPAPAPAGHLGPRYAGPAGGDSAGGRSTGGDETLPQPGGDDALPYDDAVIASATFPATLATDPFLAAVTVTNTGTTTWRHNEGYALGALDDDDPFTDEVRDPLPPGRVVAPGNQFTFHVRLDPPAIPGNYTSDWRMHGPAGWFGEITSHVVGVCGGSLDISASQTAPLSGAVELGVSTSAGCADEVTFYIDGVAQAAVTTGPFVYAWETAANTLPLRSHPLDFAYYFTDGRYGEFEAEVRPYTTSYYAWAWRNYPTDQDWRPLLDASMARAHADGRPIHFNIEAPEYYDDALDIAAPYWSSVLRMEIADEPPWSKSETESILADVRSKLDARGLAHVPLGIVYYDTQIMDQNAFTAAGLDWVGIECYVDPPGNPNSRANVEWLMDFVNTAKGRVPPDKDIVLVMQSYARNYGWSDIDTLRDLQIPAYLLAYDDPRVLAINMFSYGRPSGTAEFTDLITPHKLIGERVLETAVAGAGNGDRTVEARVVTGGQVRWARRVFEVQNPP